MFGSCLWSERLEECSLKKLWLNESILVHPHDSLRLDLIIPGEQFFCLKAKSQSERQRWLVALGTCKSRGTKSTTSTTSIHSPSKTNNTSSTFCKTNKLEQRTDLFFSSSSITSEFQWTWTEIKSSRITSVWNSSHSTYSFD